FAITSYEMGNTVRLLSFPIMISASLLGFIGIAISVMFITIHMCKIESYGTPYFFPLAPLNVKGLKDALIRFPIWTLNTRPEDLHTKKQMRQYDSREWDNE